MRPASFAAALLAVAALSACAEVQAPSGPPVAGTATGPGAAPLSQQSRDIVGRNSGNATGGTATTTGSITSGDRGARPTIERSGATGAGIGSPTPTPLPTGGARQQGGSDGGRQSRSRTGVDARARESAAQSEAAAAYRP